LVVDLVSKKEGMMSRYKIMALVVIFTFVIGLTLLGDALAEKVKARNVMHGVKWEQVNVGDEDGHVIAVAEAKGITTNLEGKWFADGFAYHDTSLYDINLKTGLGSGQGYGDLTDKDGDKYYWTWEGKLLKGGKLGTGYWTGTWTIVRGIGKFEGIRGKGPFQGYIVGGDNMADWEGDVELRR
jgi:hypothetical protein